MGNSTKYQKIINSGVYEITGTINSLSGGYFSDFIAEINQSVGINIIYDVQPPVDQKIKFSYTIF